MSNNNFFEDSEETQEPEKVKVGETEFSSDELQELIGAGKKLKEIEEKQGQPVDEILTSWGKRGELLGKYKSLTGTKSVSELEERLAKEKELKDNPPTEDQKSQEELERQVRAELEKYGVVTEDKLSKMGVLTKEEYENIEAGKRMLRDVKKVIREAKDDGKPETTPEELLKFMRDPANPKDPRNAYDIMFKKQLEDWKQGRIEQVKKPAMATITQSTAGAKQPEFKVPSNKEDLRKSLTAVLNGEGGQ
jgi:hypothetical protein